MSWVAWAMMATLGWAVWGMAAARASGTGSAAGAVAALVLVEAVAFAWALPKVPGAFSWWLVVGGLASAGAYLAFMKSFEAGGNAGVVTAMTAMYPAVIAVMQKLGGDDLNIRQVIGIGLAVAAAAVLSR